MYWSSDRKYETNTIYRKYELNFRKHTLNFRKYDLKSRVCADHEITSMKPLSYVASMISIFASMT